MKQKQLARNVTGQVSIKLAPAAGQELMKTAQRLWRLVGEQATQEFRYCPAITAGEPAK